VASPHALAALPCDQGHNPNYDVFDLRPGLWLHPSIKPRGYHNFNFYDYVVAPEYQNSLTKMCGRIRSRCALKQTVIQFLRAPPPRASVR